MLRHQLKNLTKLHRNKPCLCGSGKKYKFCHGSGINSDGPTDPSDKGANFSTEWKNSNIKLCLHPNKDECEGKIIKAHTIQNNRILTRIAVDGHVIVPMLDTGEEGIVWEGRKTGKRVATTFNGFCGRHDQMLFREIDNKDYDLSQPQNVLLAYRALAREYHTKLVAFRFRQRQFRSDSTLYQNEQLILDCRLTEMGVQDLGKYMKRFESLVLSDTPDSSLQSLVLVFDGEAQLAVSSPLSLDHDFDGEQIITPEMELDQRNPLPTMFFNIFPQEGSTYAVFSWFDVESASFNRIEEQLRKRASQDVLTILNWLIATHCEMKALSPTLWDSFDEEKMQSFFGAQVTDMMRPTNTHFEHADVASGFDLLPDISLREISTVGAA
jgi:hypothetical protein